MDITHLAAFALGAASTLIVGVIVFIVSGIIIGKRFDKMTHDAYITIKTPEDGGRATP